MHQVTFHSAKGSFTLNWYPGRGLGSSANGELCLVLKFVRHVSLSMYVNQGFNLVDKSDHIAEALLKGDLSYELPVFTNSKNGQPECANNFHVVTALIKIFEDEDYIPILIDEKIASNFQ